METREKEIWKPIPEYEGLYEVSNYGRVKSLDKEVKYSNGRVDFIPSRILKPKIRRAGYYSIGLSKSKKQKTHYIHRLVALCFIENKMKLRIVNHIDSNRVNNFYKNLEWVNHRENIGAGMLNSDKVCNFIGVSFKKETGKYNSRITVNSKTIWLGTYDTEEAAKNAYLNALKEHGLQNKYATQSPNI